MKMDPPLPRVLSTACNVVLHQRPAPFGLSRNTCNQDRLLLFDANFKREPLFCLHAAPYAANANKHNSQPSLTNADMRKLLWFYRNTLMKKIAFDQHKAIFTLQVFILILPSQTKIEKNSSVMRDTAGHDHQRPMTANE